MPDDTKAKFATWLRKVDIQLEKLCGLFHRDLADQTWRDWFEDEMTPKDAAEECLANEGFSVK